MPLSKDLVETITKGHDQTAWEVIVSEVLSICSEPMTIPDASKLVMQRDREVGAIDNLLSQSAWELWNVFETCVPKTSREITKWWKEPHSAKAVLILDGLSLRELPWLLQGAESHGFEIHNHGITGSEVPSETSYFAHSLGFASRSSLANDGAGSSHQLAGAKTETSGIPWKDAGSLINANPNWVFWHHNPDDMVHQFNEQGQGLDLLTKNCAENFSSPDFWEFVGRLAHGRSLVITADHGYAACGQFGDAEADAQTFLKTQLKSARTTPGGDDVGPFIPPILMRSDNQHGVHRNAIGRWKWKSQGGYPTLTHGGISLLEVLVPWVELTKKKV